MIHCLGGRVILPELMDHAPPEPTRRSLSDLVLINQRLGGHRILIDRLLELVSPSEPFSLLDIGAASGDMAKEALRRFPRMSPINLDRRALHLENASHSKVVSDAFELPFADCSLDFVHCSLFLHHFSDDDVVRLLKESWRVARHGLIVQDLERHPLAYYFLPATKWLFRWSNLVLHDGPISVEAAFKPGELASFAAAAGIPGTDIRTHRPAFRLSMVAVRS